MRGTFVQTLEVIAEEDPRVILITGDLGFMVVENFAERFPNRFINAGVAEQNMVGIATGMAEAGFIPFVYSIVTFASLRPYEFIRNGPILHRLPVRVVAVGGGFEYGHAGPTHWGLEDIATMRTQPDLTVLAPADFKQTRTMLRKTWDLPGPIYYRLGKDDKYEVAGLDGRFELARAQQIRRGNDLLWIVMGSVSREVVMAAELLSDAGISSEILAIASVNPAPTEDIAEACSRFPLVITVEAHFVAGGIGSLVSEIISENGIGCRVIRRAVKSFGNGYVGSESFLLDQHGLSSRSLFDTAKSLIAEATV